MDNIMDYKYSTLLLPVILTNLWSSREKFKVGFR